MSLLDVNNSELDMTAIWSEYDKLEADLEENLNQIDQIYREFNWVEQKVSRKAIMAVQAAWLWWILAINLLWIYTVQDQKKILRICYY